MTHIRDIITAMRNISDLAIYTSFIAFHPYRTNDWIMKEVYERNIPLAIFIRLFAEIQDTMLNNVWLSYDKMEFLWKRY